LIQDPGLALAVVQWQSWPGQEYTRQLQKKEEQSEAACRIKLVLQIPLHFCRVSVLTAPSADLRMYPRSGEVGQETRGMRD
jgi:hypothetical protein